MEWAGHAACAAGKCTQRFGEEPKRKILLGASRCRREDIKMDHEQDGKGLDWISDKRCAAVNKVMNFGFRTMQRIL